MEYEDEVVVLFVVGEEVVLREVVEVVVVEGFEGRL